MFRNIRIYPQHGTRSATVTWDMSDDAPAGTVYLAFSNSAVKGSWDARNGGAGVASTLGMIADDRLVINAGLDPGYYRLLLVDEQDENHFSQPIQILGDMTPEEYGVARAMIHREYVMMSARGGSGYPVWHCIPKREGEYAGNYDEDEGRTIVTRCPPEGADKDGYGEDFVGGFYTPVLTWILPVALDQQVRESQDDLGSYEKDNMVTRMLAFPIPRSGHLIIDPATDRRYEISPNIRPAFLRATYPVAWDTELVFIKQSDPRYRFQPPFIDTRAYRRLPYWQPEVLS